VTGFDSSNAGKQQPTNLTSKEGLIQRLRKGARARARLVDSHISKILAFQTRYLRDKAGWSQQQLAEKIGSNQNAIYRAENPNYGKQTLTTLKKIAAAFDVALVVRFVPFGELVDWDSGTPRTINGLNTEALEVENFSEEFEQPPTTDQAIESEMQESDARGILCGKEGPKQGGVSIEMTTEKLASVQRVQMERRKQPGQEVFFPLGAHGGLAAAQALGQR
jgi:transcriptional regulator with XRE-family HTH domain